MNSTEIYSTRPKSSLWTTSELAGFLGCSERQVYNLRKRGLPALHVGGMIRFDPQAVHQWLASDRTPAVNDSRADQLADIAASGDEDNAECATSDLAREFPDD